MPEIIVIAHNIRSTHNVGAIFRTCEGFGVQRLILSGYTPYPDLSLQPAPPHCAYHLEETVRADPRLPHIREKITQQIHKTALGAEALVPFDYQSELDLEQFAGYRIVALEQAPTSVTISQYQPPDKLVLLLGEEVHGIPAETLTLVDDIIEIPMYGQKESFNVSVATGIALYALTTAG